MVSTVLFMSGVTTLLHTFFGTRLPLIQGPSYVYLAPALAIINSPEFQKLNGNVCLYLTGFCLSLYELQRFCFYHIAALCGARSLGGFPPDCHM